MQKELLAPGGQPLAKSAIQRYIKTCAEYDAGVRKEEDVSSPATPNEPG